MIQSKKRSNCPIGYSLDIWWDKWSFLILRDLFFNGKCTYGDFRKSPEKISTNILASRLQSLEEHAIIERMPYPDSKIKILYGLTEKWINLFPLFVEIYLWADKYTHIPHEIWVYFQAAKEGKEEFIKNLTEKMKNTL